MYVIAAIAAVGLVGFMMLKKHKAKLGGGPTAISRAAAPENTSLAPAAPESSNAQEAQWTPPIAPAAPESASRATSADDPELTRLWNVEQQANQSLMVAIASGDASRVTAARQGLAEAENALRLKKQSMY